MRPRSALPVQSPRRMRTLAVLPIKSFGAAKSRLADVLGTAARRTLAEAMFRDTLSSLSQVPGLDAVAVVSAGDMAAEAAAAGERVTLLRDEREAGHNPAAEIGVRHALRTGCERLLLVPGDTPVLDPGEVSGLLEAFAAGGPGLIVIPDRHGTGTNGLLLAPPDALPPSFGPDSLRRHVEQAKLAGLRHSVERLPSLALDVDTPEDLAELWALLEARPGLAPLTRAELGRGSTAAA